MVRFSEVIRDRLGWCPNANTMKTGSRSGTGIALFSGEPRLQERGSPGADMGPNLGYTGYEHTQRGTTIIAAVSAAILLILTITLFLGIEWVALIVLCILVFVLSITSSLTVSLGSGLLRIRFGPLPLVRKSWPVAEIVSVTTVTNPWYYGFGIRWTPSGMLYNVSGKHAIEVLMDDGTMFRIGTDEPEALKNAVERAQESRGS